MDRSVKEVTILSPDEAKAILLARAAGIDAVAAGFSGAGFGSQDELTFDIYAMPGGWYVYCHGSPTRADVHTFVSADWSVSPLTLGPPPGFTESKSDGGSK